MGRARGRATVVQPRHPPGAFGGGGRRPGRGVLRRPQGERHEPGHDGAAVREPAEGRRRGRRRRHRLHPRRHVQDRQRRLQHVRRELRQERSVRRQAHQLLRVPRGDARVRLLAAATVGDGHVRRLLRDRIVAALQGDRDLARPHARHRVEQRALGGGRQQQRLRAAQHAPQQRPRPLDCQGKRGEPGCQLRLARQLRRERRARGRSERRRLRVPLSDQRPQHDLSGLPRLVEFRRRVRPDLAGGSRHLREQLGDGQRHHQFGNGEARLGQRQRVQGGQQQDGHPPRHQELFGLEEHGGGFLRQPLVGREHLVQQHVVRQRHAIQHAGQPVG